MRHIATLLTSRWKHPVSMESLKASLEQMLGLSFFFSHALINADMEEEIVIDDRSQPLHRSGRGIEIHRAGNAPEKLTLEELVLLPPELQEEDARCIATVSRSGNNPLSVVVHRCVS